MKKGINLIIKYVKKIKKWVKNKNNLIKFKKDIITYLKTNILTISFLLLSIINGILLRYLTVKNYFNIKPILGDLVFLLLIIAFAYLLKPKNQYKYYLIWSIILCIICFANCIYYSNYISFLSVSLLKTSSELGGYTDAVTNIIELKDFLFLLQIPILTYIHNILKKKNYYDKVKEIEIGKTRLLITAGMCLFFGLIFLSTLTATDFSRLNKQWDRRYTVMEFGVYTYQVNDILSSIRIKLTSSFDSSSAYDEFLEFYRAKELENQNTKNKYTNIFKGKNVIVIHGESMQDFAMNVKFNDKVLTPNLNKLASEGMFFSNFYAEESIGNSSDSEFTSLTSLLPVTSGTVFVNYFNREYVSMPKLLKEKGYYTFSMHANVATAWNRNNAYKKLGYDHFYAYKDAYEIDEELGLGLSDKSFFRQSTDIIKEIKENNGNFYGTLVMLTNHTPFTGLEGTDYEDDYIVNLIDGEDTIPYLENTKIGNYFKTINYADSALGEFINELDENGLLDNTVIVLYGDHDCKIKKSEFEKFYYNENIDKVLIDPSKKIDVIDSFTYEINRKVPFIIWTKDMAGSKYNKEINKVMGMVDVMPTLGNMLGVSNYFAIGHDIFNIDENVVVFPSGNFITDKIYYDNSSDKYRQLDLNSSISLDDLVKYKDYANKVISVSNNIIIYNLIDKYNRNEKLFN